MQKFANSYLSKIYEDLEQRNKGMDEFLQAVAEVLHSIEPIIDLHPELEANGIVEKMVEPERLIQFQVPWMDDNGKTRVNRAFRVHFNGTLGPYKGGMRFHPSVNASIVSFLSFEQTFKNALVSLPMGGGKGGSDFDPKGKSEGEVRRFCQSLMVELYKYLGQFTDVPAGDIGVGAREVGYMFGQYRRITDEFTGVFTGKIPSNSGSLGRKEATGYGLIYIVEKMLEVVLKDSFEGKKVIVSGSGNVAIHAAQKAASLGGVVITASDSGGYILDESGINLEVLKQIKEVERLRISEYVNRVPRSFYFEGSKNIWGVKADIALPCATENELDLNGAKALVKNSVIAVAEGSNMGTTSDAAQYLIENRVLYLPGKASNAGGVTVSGLEMSQNSLRLSWSSEEVDKRMKEVMVNIFNTIHETAKKYNKPNNYLVGANIASFLKLAEAMVWQGN